MEHGATPIKGTLERGILERVTRTKFPESRMKIGASEFASYICEDICRNKLRHRDFSRAHALQIDYLLLSHILSTFQRPLANQRAMKLPYQLSLPGVVKMDDSATTKASTCRGNGTPDTNSFKRFPDLLEHTTAEEKNFGRIFTFLRSRVREA